MISPLDTATTIREALKHLDINATVLVDPNTDGYIVRTVKDGALREKKLAGDRPIVDIVSEASRWAENPEREVIEQAFENALAILDSTGSAPDTVVLLDGSDAAETVSLGPVPEQGPEDSDPVHTLAMTNEQRIDTLEEAMAELLDRRLSWRDVVAAGFILIWLGTVGAPYIMTLLQGAQ